MLMYRYRAINRDSTAIEGELASESEEGLIAKLRDQGLTLVDLRVISDGTDEDMFTRDLGFSLEIGISRKKLAFFARQLAITLHAGIPLSRIFSTLYYQTSSNNLKRIIRQIGRDIQLGESLSSSMAKHKNVFDNLFLSMISLGEVSGTLPQATAKLATLMEKEIALKRKLKSATIYPAFVIFFSFALSYALIALVMPGFIPIFESTGIDIAGEYPLTYFLIEVSKAVTNPWFVGIGVLGLLFFTVLLGFLGRNKRGRFVIDYIKFNFPFINPIIRLGIATRFCRSFSTLAKSGVQLLKVLSLTADGSGNLVVSSALEKVAIRLREGERMSVAMKKTGVFPELVIQMVSIGEEAGTIPDMLERIADYYEEEMESAIETMTSLLEPAMMIIVGLIVGSFVMGILLPIMGIATRFMN